MILRYRVSLHGIKGFTRVYDLPSSMSLYDFHKLLRLELEFPQDQLIQFKAQDSEGQLVARYGLFDIGYGTVDNISLMDTINKGIASFLYFYDVTNRKSVIITFEGEVSPNPKLIYPALIETKGPLPIEFEKGYVAFEDRPTNPIVVDKGWGKTEDTEFDDIDEDTQEDEDSEEQEEEIYDDEEDL